MDRPPIELRTVTFSEINHPERIIDLIAVPYNEWAAVQLEDRMIQESFAPGAFGAVRNRADRARFQVNIEHDPERWVGRVVGLEPDHPDGLRAELRIRRTPEGDQVLVDAEDGMYAASVGFGVYPRDQEWVAKDRRRITKAYLDHIALTPTPAYAGAGVISVRNEPRSSTPRLDRVLAELAQREYPGLVR
jgi:HK97 family phage prohead protease